MHIEMMASLTRTLKYCTHERSMMLDYAKINIV